MLFLELSAESRFKQGHEDVVLMTVPHRKSCQTFPAPGARWRVYLSAERCEGWSWPGWISASAPPGSGHWLYLLVLKCPGLRADFPSPDLRQIHLRANKEKTEKPRGGPPGEAGTRGALGLPEPPAPGQEPGWLPPGHSPAGPAGTRASEGPGRPWPGGSEGPATRGAHLGPGPASAAPTLRPGSPGRPAAAGPNLRQRQGFASRRRRPPRAPPASHSLGQVVTSGPRHLEPVKSASSSRPASVSSPTPRLSGPRRALNVLIK